MGFTAVFSLVLGVTIACLWLWSRIDLEWTHVTVEILSASQHPAIMSPFMILIARSLIAIIIWSSTLYIILDPVGLEITLERADKTKRTYLLKGFSRITMFTVWSWILQGIYFTVAAVCSFAVVYQSEYPEVYRICHRILPSIAWICFEISFPIAYLVSAVVTFVLIPFTKKARLPVKTFFLPMAILMHNANVMFMALEFMINELQFSYYHFIFMLFYGLAYVVFSWVWHHYHGMFYYFFLDYHRPYAFWWHLALLSLVSVLFFIGYYLSKLQFHGYSLPANLVVSVLTIASMKFVDN